MCPDAREAMTGLTDVHDIAPAGLHVLEPMDEGAAWREREEQGGKETSGVSVGELRGSMVAGVVSFPKL